MANNATINIVKVKTSDMHPHPIAQREFDLKHAEWLARNFNWDEYKPIDVSFRDGKYWVIDGQHRLYAIRKRNNNKECAIVCRVHDGMTELDEANFFLNQTKGTKAIHIKDRLNVLYKIGDKDVMAMVRGAHSAGWNIDFTVNKEDGKIIALSTLQKIYKALTYEQYVAALRTAYMSWNGKADGACREMLLGIGLFFKTYYGRFSETELVRNLQKISPLEILRDGRALKTSTASNGNGIFIGKPFARCILNIYNSNRRKNKLEDII